MPKLKIDPRILEPGFAGELAPDEFEYIVKELLRDKKLSFAWGFQPGKKRRAEWAVRSVAEFGDPDNRKTNMGLARIPRNPEGNGPSHEGENGEQGHE